MSSARRLLPALVLVAGTAVAAGEAPIPVRTAAYESLVRHPQRQAPATVVSLNETEVSAEIAARIVRLPVRVGDAVEAGATLAELDCRDYRLELAEQQAGLEALEARIELPGGELERAERLARTDSLAEDVRDERQTALAALRAERRAARAGLERRRLAIERCTVTSPFRALVLERIAAVGERATPGSPLVRVLDLGALEVSAQLPYEDAPLLARARDPAFAFAGRRYPLRLRTVLPAVDTATRTREVRLELAGDRPPAGAAGKLVWDDPRPHLPAELFVRRGDDYGVFIVNDAHARFVPAPGAEPGRSNPIDLPPGSRVVVAGHHGLEDGDAIAAE